jgi:cyclophilin family peptidyl-prolyl cis-trans isomerase
MPCLCYTRRARAAALFVCAVWLAGCGGPSVSDQPKKAAATKPAAPRVMPDVYRVRFTTTKGAFTVEVHKEWAPLAAERFWKLVDLGFFDDSKFFRVKRNFVVQFGVAADPRLNQLFDSLPIKDDPVKQHNVEGMLSFAASGPGTRRTQIFINLKDNRVLDKSGFAPFAKLVDGRMMLEMLYSGYGEMAPLGAGCDPRKLATEGNAYADAKFPRLDGIVKAEVVD